MISPGCFKRILGKRGNSEISKSLIEKVNSTPKDSPSRSNFCKCQGRSYFCQSQSGSYFWNQAGDIYARLNPPPFCQCFKIHCETRESTSLSSILFRHSSGYVIYFPPFQLALIRLSSRLFNPSQHYFKNI